MLNKSNLKAAALIRRRKRRRIHLRGKTAAKMRKRSRGRKTVK
jgi:hypothetical protein